VPIRKALEAAGGFRAIWCSLSVNEDGAKAGAICPPPKAPIQPTFPWPPSPLRQGAMLGKLSLEQKVGPGLRLGKLFPLG